MTTKLIYISILGTVSLSRTEHPCSLSVSSKQYAPERILDCVRHSLIPPHDLGLLFSPKFAAIHAEVAATWEAISTPDCLGSAAVLKSLEVWKKGEPVHTLALDRVSLCVHLGFLPVLALVGYPAKPRPHQTINEFTEKLFSQKIYRSTSPLKSAFDVLNRLALKTEPGYVSQLEFLLQHKRLKRKDLVELFEIVFRDQPKFQDKLYHALFNPAFGKVEPSWLLYLIAIPCGDTCADEAKKSQLEAMHKLITYLNEEPLFYSEYHEIAMWILGTAKSIFKFSLTETYLNALASPRSVDHMLATFDVLVDGEYTGRLATQMWNMVLPFVRTREKKGELDGETLARLKMVS